jgi:nucleotide-binding universal stress UspA family protein
MNSTTNDVGDRGRVLLLFDASPASLAALHAALKLAGRARPLDVLYVEEQDWLRCAGFGFAAEVGALSGSLRQHDPARAEQRLARQRERVRRALLTALAPETRQLKLEIRRGRTLDEVLAMVGPDDLMVAGRVGHTSRIGRSFGSLAMTLARQAPGTVLLSARPGLGNAERVAVLLDQPDAAAGVLAQAAARARRDQASLCVLLVDAGVESALVPDWQAGLDVPVQLIRLPATDPNRQALMRALSASAPTELIISRRSPLFNSPLAARVLARVPGSVSVLP